MVILRVISLTCPCCVPESNLEALRDAWRCPQGEGDLEEMTIQMQSLALHRLGSCGTRMTIEGLLPNSESAGDERCAKTDGKSDRVTQTK